MFMQEPLITDGRNSCKWTGPTVGLSIFFLKVRISGQNFNLMDSLDSYIDRGFFETLVFMKPFWQGLLRDSFGAISSSLAGFSLSLIYGSTLYFT